SRLAAHLLKVDDNEHIELYELKGFVAEDLPGALQEIYAISRGTKCEQYMFSVSLNPPETESVPVEYFEKAIADIEAKLGLEGQPRAIVFHEKEGRRHAHCVWSRIEAEEMKAINLPYYKMKLQDVSRQLYFQYGWDLPKGLLNWQERNPLNFTLAQWQQAKRTGEDPQLLQKMFQDCWAASDNKASFEQALNGYGLYLAKGDRRGFIALDYRREVYSLSRWTKIQTKTLKERLGDPEL
ncbi:MAG TPA: relaxase, partial [Rhodospirillaceae bacterium]|nr:relaxase [Rhodospirillaceae bacterium]